MQTSYCMDPLMLSQNRPAIPEVHPAVVFLEIVVFLIKEGTIIH